MAKRKPVEARRGPGAPVTVGADQPITMKQPGELVAAMRMAAAQAGISASDAWRRAAREWLERK